MNGLFPHTLRSLGPEEYALWGSFAPNAAGAPTTLRGSRGLQYTVTYSATGLYNVTIAAALGQFANAPLCAIATAEFDGTDIVTHWFEVGVVRNRLNSSNRDFQILAHRSGTAREVAANAANRINFLVGASENTGR